MRKAHLAACCLVAISFAASAQEKRSGSVWESRKSSWEGLAPADRSAVMAFAERYKEYLRGARTALTSTREVLRVARAAGFAELHDPAQVKPGARLAIAR